MNIKLFLVIGQTHDWTDLTRAIEFYTGGVCFGNAILREIRKRSLKSPGLGT